MEITNVKTLIENTLACIDIENKNEETHLDSQNNPSILKTRLQGMKQVLSVMGFNLEINLNPYYYENKKPSTYTLTLES